MRKKITVVGYVPTRSGYLPLDDLSAAGREALTRRLVDRMGAALAPHITNLRGEEDGIADWSPAKN